MKNFLRDITYKNQIKSSLKKINIIFIVFLFFSYLLFCGIYSIKNLWTVNAYHYNIENFNTIENLLLNLEISTTSYNKNLSMFLGSLQNIISQLNHQKRPFTHKNGHFRIILDYLSQHQIPKIEILRNYTNFLNFIKNLLQIEKNIGYKDIYQLLKPGNTYLIILENIGEVRPNGGFFGSYGILKIFNTGVETKIFDAYYPIHIKKVYLPIKENFLQKLISGNKINFISPNIWGFSDKDGKNIKALYEKTFTGEKITGVIFVKSSLFENLYPELRQKIYEWQFINASIDLIRGKRILFKKAIYLKQINNFIKENKLKTLNTILKDWDKITKNGYIKLYLPKVSKEFKSFLEKNNLISKRNNNCFYFFDFNFGYNKIDRFLQKNIFVFSGEKLIKHIYNKNKLCLKNYPKNLKLKIIYFLNIPENYIEFIKNLEKKYKIKLTDREKAILGLHPYVKNKGIIYWPKFYNKKPTIYNYNIEGNLKKTIINVK